MMNEEGAAPGVETDARVAGRGVETDGPVAPSPRVAYEPALDGLRALAVMAVILYHQFGGWANGGFLGVDVFFVLSGYLITSILLSEHSRTGGIDAVQFWTRRARRLLPAMGVFLLLVAGYAAFAAPPISLGRIRSDSVATLFYVENYWQASRNFQALPLGHMWSLAIEGQFYLAWPLVLGGLLVLFRKRSRLLFGAIALLAAASAASMILRYHGSNFGQVHVATETRAQELLVGALLAVLFAHGVRPTTRAGRIALEIAGLAGLAAFVAMIYIATDPSDWLYRGGFTIVAIVAAITIAAAVQPGSPVLGRALSLRPLVWIGLLSYGLYLFHLPIDFILTEDRVGQSGVALFAVRFAATLALAVVSYRLVERPLRNARVSGARFLGFAASAAVVVVAVVFVSTNDAVHVNVKNLETALYQRYAAAAPPGATKVFVTGDAIALSLQTKGSAFVGSGIYGVANRDWCSVQAMGLVFGSGIVRNRPCTSSIPSFRAAIDAFQPGASVVMMGTQETLDRVDHNRRLAVGTPEAAEFLAAQLERSRAILTARGAPMLLATVPCMRLPALGVRGPADAARRIAWVNDQLRRFARQHADSVQLVEFGEFLCEGSARRTIGGESMGAPDGVHLSPVGARATWEWLAQLAEEARSRQTARTP